MITHNIVSHASLFIFRTLHIFIQLHRINTLIRSRYTAHTGIFLRLIITHFIYRLQSTSNIQLINLSFWSSLFLCKINSARILKLKSSFGSLLNFGVKRVYFKRLFWLLARRWLFPFFVFGSRFGAGISAATQVIANVFN